MSWIDKKFLNYRPNPDLESKMIYLIINTVIVNEDLIFSLITKYFMWLLFSFNYKKIIESVIFDINILKLIMLVEDNNDWSDRQYDFSYSNLSKKIDYFFKG